MSLRHRLQAFFHFPNSQTYGREASQPPTASNPEGNNRAVINGSNGAIEQTAAYYPYGAVISDLDTPTTGQPYNFSANELITAKFLVCPILQKSAPHPPPSANTTAKPNPH